jgi:hypothetical protein
MVSMDRFSFTDKPMELIFIFNVTPHYNIKKPVSVVENEGVAFSEQMECLLLITGSRPIKQFPLSPPWKPVFGVVVGKDLPPEVGTKRANALNYFL